MKPRALIIRTAGTNCDRELAFAFELAGATASTVHLNRLIDEPGIIDEAELVGFPGGFSYGDDIGAGRILADRLRHRLMAPLLAAIDRGVPMIGICNGFQVLVKMGLLPDPHAGTQTVTLADNTTGRFIDRWVGLATPADTCCIWTRGLNTLELPIAHGEGRFVPANDEVLRRLRENHQVALRYAAVRAEGQVERAEGRDKSEIRNPKSEIPFNPNGSIDDIAGICDPSGLVLGLMPHPERYTHPTHHPQWTRRRALGRDVLPAGLRLFQNAVEHVKSALSQPHASATSA